VPQRTKSTIRLGHRVRWEPPDEDPHDFLKIPAFKARKKVVEAWLKEPVWRDLVENLVAKAGEHVVEPQRKPTKASIADIGATLSRGQEFLPAKRAPGGVVSRCHYNAAAIWVNRPYEVWIATGFALSDDGWWRPHSWLIERKSGDVIETTADRELYFGYVLTLEEAEEFARANL
jgi:hypothetical protein